MVEAGKRAVEEGVDLRDVVEIEKETVGLRKELKVGDGGG